MKAKTISEDDETALIKRVKFSSNVPSHILEAFDLLVPDNPTGQAKASVTILKYVDSLINQAAPGQILSNEVVYIIKRLVSGLVSNRQRVREGFCSTLQALLQLQPATVPLAYKALLELCSNTKGLSSEESRNFLTGELLGYGALIRAGHVKGNTVMRQEIIKRMFVIRERKQYYDIIVSHYLVHMMEKLTKSVIYQEVLNVLLPELSVPLEALTPCKLWVRLVILRKFPEFTPDSFAKTLSEENYSTIASIIVKTAINMPNIHPLMSEVISTLATTSKPRGKSKVVKFWVDGLAPYLKEPTTNCLQLLFNALQLTLLKLNTAKDFRKVCNSDIVTHLLNVMSLHDKNLSASARGVGSALLQLATVNYEQDNSLQLAIAEMLIRKPGNARFDQLTGTKLLGQMKIHFTPATILAVSEILRETMMDNSGQIRTTDKVGCAQFLAKLVSLPQVNTPEYESWKKEQMLWLMSYALTKPGIKGIVEEYQEIFFRCLGTQMSRIKEYLVTLQYLHKSANKSVLESKETDKPLLSPKCITTWEKIVMRLDEIKKESKLSPVALEVFQVLYLQMALYLLATIEAKDIINELDSCYKEAKKGKKKSTINRAGEVLYESSWVDRVVELLLTLLPHENSLFRTLAQGVFWLLCPLMTPLALTSIVDVLDPAKQESLINIEDENPFDDDDEEEEDDEDLDEEESDDDSGISQEDEEDSDEDVDDEEIEGEDEEEDMDDDDEDEDFDIDDEEDEALLKLKKEMLSLTGDVEDDVDMDSVSQEELDTVNSKLGSLVGEYLRQRHSKSFKKKGFEKLHSDERQLMHFRSRVCDLLELYLKEAPNMGLILGLINPLVTALSSFDQDRKRQEELLTRIRTLLFLVGKIQKFDDIGNATIDMVVEEFNTFFSLAVKVRDCFNPIIRGCYFLFIRCGCQVLGEEAHNPNNMLIQSYISHLREIFTQNHVNLKTRTYTDVCLTDCGALWKVAELMKEYSFSQKFKCFWRTQAMQILTKLFKNEPLLARVDEDVLLNWEKDLSANICMILHESTPLRSIQGQYLSDVFTLLGAIHKRETTKKRTSGIDWKEVGSVLVSLRHRLDRTTFQTCRGPFNTIINYLGLVKSLAISLDQAAKRKAEELKEASSAAANGVNHEGAEEKPEKKIKKLKVKHDKNESNAKNVQQEVKTKGILKKTNESPKEIKKKGILKKTNESPKEINKKGILKTTPKTEVATTKTNIQKKAKLEGQPNKKKKIVNK